MWDILWKEQLSFSQNLSSCLKAGGLLLDILWPVSNISQYFLSKRKKEGNACVLSNDFLSSLYSRGLSSRIEQSPQIVLTGGVVAEGRREPMIFVI